MTSWGWARSAIAFADLLFSGTSTLQTRAQCSFFVPWIYRYFVERAWEAMDEWKQSLVHLVLQ